MSDFARAADTRTLAQVNAANREFHGQQTQDKADATDKSIADVNKLNGEFYGGNNHAGMAQSSPTSANAMDKASGLTGSISPPNPPHSDPRVVQLTVHHNGQFHSATLHKSEAHAQSHMEKHGIKLSKE
jgi:hypothetical protein